jgi:Uma2 family endonuclease
LGWLIDPDDQSILVYPPGQPPQFFAAGADVLPVPAVASGLQLTLAEIFGWLKFER